MLCSCLSLTSSCGQFDPRMAQLLLGARLHSRGCGDISDRLASGKHTLWRRMQHANPGLHVSCFLA